MDDINVWRTVTLGLAALGQTAFALLYLLFPWWQTFLGRALFYKALMLGLMIDFAWASRTFDFGRSDKFFVPLYALLAIGVWWQFAAFVRVKRRGDQELGRVGIVGKVVSFWKRKVREYNEMEQTHE